MRVFIAVHRCREGGYWAEIPAMGNCFTQGETLDEVRLNIVDLLETLLWLSPPEKRRVKCTTWLEADVEISIVDGKGSSAPARQKGVGSAADSRKPPRSGARGKHREIGTSGSRKARVETGHSSRSTKGSGVGVKHT